LVALNTLFQSNKTYSNFSNGNGGAVAGGVATFESCQFISNQAGNNYMDTNSEGGAISNNAASAGLTVRNCVFKFNNAKWKGYGGAISMRSGIVSNSIFYDNNATHYGSYGGFGGAIRYSGSGSETYNCTFYSNGDYDQVSGGSPIISNCIFDTGAIDIGSYTITYSDVEGGFMGEGNIDANPMFVNAATGDLRLQSTSPCIDNANGAVAPEFDLDGNARVDIGTISNEYECAVDAGVDCVEYADMGAYEYQPT
jgi:hypothetical protein